MLQATTRCRAIVCDAGPALNQHLIDVSCLLVYLGQKSFNLVDFFKMVDDLSNSTKNALANVFF